MATPQVPPRPARSPRPQQQQSTTIPQVPPRPAGRHIERSQSPSRFAPSPLNDIPFNAPNVGGPYGNHKHSASQSSLDVPMRPPSVNLPSIGQEGNEYGEIEAHESKENLHKTISGSSHTTSHVGSDLPLHAPTPSLSKSDQKARIATVTRTDSQQAAASGFGKITSPTEPRDPYNRPLKSKTSASFVRSTSSLSTERPGSAMEEEGHGIPQIGQHVPMLPHAGDVQAPSPAPGSQHPAGIGFHNDGSKPRHHGRTRSGKEVFRGPPGSYGLHGHGMTSTDKFEKAWYDKHPELAAREEHGQYSPAVGDNRPEWAMSSEDLNKIVHANDKGSGFGTNENVVGLPPEQIGYLASEQYANRMSSPRPQSGIYGSKAHSNSSQTHMESPLRKTSFPADALEREKADKVKAYGRPSSEYVAESEAEDEPIHIDPPEHQWSKYGKEGHVPTVDLGPHAGNTDGEGGYYEERGYGVPILASDEAHPGQEYLQPAVPPTPQGERRGSIQDELYLHRTGSAGNSRPTSRPGSRPGSIHGMAHLSRFISHDDEGMHTPLEDVEEYEPLFPEDEEKPKKLKTQADRLKHRPDMRKRFPSQDIWEDAPASVNLQAEVQTPEPVEAQPPPATTKSTFEPPEAEAARKEEVSEAEKAKLIPKEERLAASHFKPHLRAEMHRPGLQQRFPSQDIWEDSPDSSKLETTVGSAVDDEVTSPKDAGLGAGAIVNTQTLSRDGATAGQPIVPPRPSRSKGAADAELPQIPTRPRKQASDSTPESASPTESRKPSIPDRPKPHVPPRPNKQSSQDSAETPLTKTISAASAGSTESAGVKSPPIGSKPKPQVPARPAGSKIAALQAGFMADLNSRLKVGPQPTKTQEEEKPQEEKEAPQDARKGRARGPAKRKPAASPSAAAATKPSELTFSISTPSTIFSISPAGDLHVPSSKPSSAPEPPASVEPNHTTESHAPGPMATNTAGEPLHPSETAPIPGNFPADADEEPSAQVPQTTRSAEYADEATQDDPVPSVSKDEPVAPMPASAELAEKGLADKDEPLENTMSTELADKENEEPLKKTTSADMGVQTGEKELVMGAEGEEKTRMTVVEGGDAQGEGEGNVVVRE